MVIRGGVTMSQGKVITDPLMESNLRAALRHCRDAPVDGPVSLPPVVYTNPAVTALEMDKIFRRHWICVGRSDLIAEHGSYACLDFCDHALIITRDKAGIPHAFSNSCRHRGARLLDGSGKTAGIVCPFHSWAYNLEGNLVGAPQMEAAAGFCKSKFRLPEYSIAENLGFLFVHLSDTPPDLSASLGNFSAIHTHWPLAELVSTRRRVFEVGCNWKAFLEVFNEYYHLPSVHPNTIDDLYMRPDPGDATTGYFASQFGSTEGTGALLQTAQERPLPHMPGLNGKEASGVRYSWLFPNMTFAVGVDALWLYEAYPMGPDRCQVVQTACFPPETVARTDFGETVVAYYHRLDAALDEDIPALLNQQIGLTNPAAQQGRLQPLLESNVTQFAYWYSHQLLS